MSKRTHRQRSANAARAALASDRLFDKPVSALLGLSQEQPMPYPFRLFSNLPIQRKLLLTSIIPVLAVILLSLVTYRSVQTFSDDEEQLNNIYLVQRRAAEYMSLMGDLNAGFRAYVLTRQEAYLHPYQIAHDHILEVGDSIEQMVSDRNQQHDLIREVQLQVQRLMQEKDSLIKAIMAGRHVDA